jgi:hypothetical protein
MILPAVVAVLFGLLPGRAIDFHVSLFVCTNHEPETNSDAFNSNGVAAFSILLDPSGTNRRARLA